MNTRTLFPLVVVAALSIPALAAGQDYVTARSVFLRRSPSMTGAKIRELAPGDTLSRRDNVNPVPGWLPVRTTNGKAGWVGVVHVRILAIAAASTATTLTTSTAGGATGAAATRIDTSWAKQPIVQSTIRMQGGVLACGPRGDDVDDGTNLHKNRADIPVTSHLITLDAIRSLPDTALWRFNNRKHWTRADSALVMPYEGIPVTVEGFFEIVKPQATSAPKPPDQVGESTNCHSWSEDDTDWHMALVASPSEPEERAVVVEPTPRIKRNQAGWIPTEIVKLAVRKSPSAPRNEAGAARVRVTGFLLLDPVHPTHIRGHCTSACDTKTFFRATLWEVHPVTRIEVFKGGQWVDLTPP
jgi:hypothetical protein